jgi:arylsulfatase A-like enzyme
MIVNVDLAPTIMRLAGLNVPATVDGRSFRPLLIEDMSLSMAWRQAFPIARWSGVRSHTNTYPSFRGVRTRRYTWAEWANGERELYDLIADPYQLRNIAGARGLNDLRARLSALTAMLSTCAGATCRDAERRPAP